MHETLTNFFLKHCPGCTSNQYTLVRFSADEHQFAIVSNVSPSSFYLAEMQRRSFRNCHEGVYRMPNRAYILHLLLHYNSVVKQNGSHTSSHLHFIIIHLQSISIGKSPEKKPKVTQFQSKAPADLRPFNGPCSCLLVVSSTPLSFVSRKKHVLVGREGCFGRTAFSCSGEWVARRVVVFSTIVRRGCCVFTEPEEQASAKELEWYF